MNRDLNRLQIELLNWISEGCPAGAEPSQSYKSSALALQNRRLVEISKRGGGWRASLTDAGRHYLQHDDYPPGHFLAKPVKQPPPSPAPKSAAKSGELQSSAERKRGRLPAAVETWVEVDSPARIRARGLKPRGDGLRTDGSTDPWDARVLVSVKEAAWLLSISEHEIRRAATGGDVQRVFIGQGTTHYRIVYGSLLAWVNDMPRRPARHPWWY